MAMPNLLDVLALNNDDGLVAMWDAVIKAHPAIDKGVADTIPGQSYETLVRTTVPSVGFRNANEGVAPVKAAYENRMVQTMILDCSAEVDKAVADTYRKGGRWGLVAKEQGALVEGALRSAESQFFYGRQTAVATSTALQPTKGYFGLCDLVDATNMVVDAGGTTSSIGSSVWFVAWGEDLVHWVIGQDGALQASEPYECRLTDGSTNPYDGIRAPLLAYLGLQLVNTHAFARIKKLTTDSGKGLTDALMYQCLDKFPGSISPTAIYMTKRSRAQLRSARTATNATGQPAPNPTEFEGVPIWITDGIVNTEELV